VSKVEPSLVEKAGEANWLEYETRVNDTVGRHDDPVICTYDLRNFSASLIMDMLRVHPVVIVGGGAIARQFGLSQSAVRKALASDMK
jgi:MEDS: MEthanogen/methylotroph, DcmR Sensory domain